jgi:hypothetical protein
MSEGYKLKSKKGSLMHIEESPQIKLSKKKSIPLAEIFN